MFLDKIPIKVLFLVDVPTLPNEIKSIEKMESKVLDEKIEIQA